MSQSESDNFNVLRIKNFPNDISDEDIVDFLKDEVDDTIGSIDIKSEKTKYNTNVWLGPGPSLLVIKKAAKLLDFKTASRTFLNGRKLYVHQQRDLTPVTVENKTEKAEQVLKIKRANNSKIIKSAKLKLWLSVVK